MSEIEGAKPNAHLQWTHSSRWHVLSETGQSLVPRWHYFALWVYNSSCSYKCQLSVRTHRLIVQFFFAILAYCVDVACQTKLTSLSI